MHTCSHSVFVIIPQCNGSQFGIFLALTAQVMTPRTTFIIRTCVEHSNSRSVCVHMVSKSHFHERLNSCSLHLLGSRRLGHRHYMTCPASDACDYLPCNVCVLMLLQVHFGDSITSASHALEQAYRCCLARYTHAFLAQVTSHCLGSRKGRVF